MALLITKAEGHAARAGLRAGHKLVAINGEPVLDFIDFNWFSAQSKLDVQAETSEGLRIFAIRKPSDEPIGLDVDSLYQEERCCANNCVFCFVDQLPRGMRKSLYVKDDDWRYSVLFGNFITLTNVSDAEFDRILRRKPSPLYVSVHATDPETRVALMKNPRSGRIMELLHRLTDAGISVHCQIVLVPGQNDGEVLKRSLEDLFGLYPGVRTVAVVPVGMTSHRGGLPVLAPVGREEALAVVNAVEGFAAGCAKRCGAHFAFAADELYERAGLPWKRYGDGEHIPQVANGVGMVNDLLDEAEWAMSELPELLPQGCPQPRFITLATGVSAYGLLVKIASELMERVNNLRIDVVRVENKLFGPGVTVAGLLGGNDIGEALAPRSLGQEVFVPGAAIRVDTDFFLDDVSLRDLSARLGVPVKAAPCDGAALVAALCGLEENCFD